MSIYDKPVRVLMRDFARETSLKRGEIVTRDRILGWFTERYPNIKRATVSAHLLRMSTNAPSRVHYSAKPEDDLFFQIDSARFRLYDASTDPPPIYVGVAPPPPPPPPPIVDPSEAASAFAYEADLRNFLSKNLALLEPGLRLYEEEGITGVEFPAGGRFIDILAVDAQQNLVVIELKVSRGHDRVVGQILRYMGWIQKNLSEPGRVVRGMIVARELSEDVLLATSALPWISLYEYEMSVTLKRVPGDAVAEG